MASFSHRVGMRRVLRIEQIWLPSVGNAGLHRRRNFLATVIHHASGSLPLAMRALPVAVVQAAQLAALVPSARCALASPISGLAARV